MRLFKLNSVTFVLSIALLTNSIISFTYCVHPDYDALMVLYNLTDGAYWAQNTGWVDGAAGNNCEPYNSDWVGIECYNNRVIKIRLFNNNVSGILPPEIENLQLLEVLHLPVNNLTGNIPPVIGNLSNLIELVLSKNLLADAIPSQLGNLQNLILLNLTEK